MVLGALGMVLQDLHQGILHSVGVVEPLDHEVLVRHFPLLSILNLAGRGRTIFLTTLHKALTASGFVSNLAMEALKGGYPRTGLRFPLSLLTGFRKFTF